MKSMARLGLAGLALAALALVGCSSKQADPPASRGRARHCRGHGRRESAQRLQLVGLHRPTRDRGLREGDGIKVNYDVFDSNEVLETKLLAGSTGYDIVVPSASFLARQIKAGIFQKLDKSQLPNLKNIDPEITKRLRGARSGQRVRRELHLGHLGRRLQRGQDQGSACPMRRWTARACSAIRRWSRSSPELRRLGPRCARPRSSARCSIYLGKDANSEKPEDLKAAEEVLMAIRPYIRYDQFLASTSRTWPTARSAWRWAGAATCCRPATAPRRPARASRSSTTSRRKARSCSSTCWPSRPMPRTPKNAHLFIDYLLRAEVAAKNSQLRATTPTATPPSWPLVDPDVSNDRGIYPTPEIKAQAGARPAESAAVHARC